MRSAEQHFTVGTVGSMIMGPNPKRTSIIFSGDGINTITISQLGVPAQGAGLQVNTSQTSIAIDRIDIGEQLSNPVYATASANGAKLTVIEGFV